MMFIKRTLVLGMAVFGAALPSHANLLVNGSFELGNFVPDPNDSMSLAIGATDMTGWTVENASLAWIGPSNPFSLSASDGGYFLDLTGYHDDAPYAGVQQTISTTIGTEYALSFDLGTDPQYDSASVSVMVTGSVGPATYTSNPLTPNQWQTFVYDFTATSVSTTIELDGQASTNQKYIGLDNVIVAEVPEPGTFTLVAGPGLLAFAAWRRLRKA